MANEQIVWRIARFKERCEYRDDQDKKGVLQYTKAFVAAGSDVESRHFMDQLDDLKEDFKHWRRLEGTLNELVRRSANDVCKFRGWLLHQHQPADVDRIARWLRCDAEECLSDLKDLTTAGFIESVPLTEYNRMMGITGAAAEFPEKPADSGKNLENPQPYKRKRTTGAGKPVSKEKETETETETKPQPAQKQSKDNAQANLNDTEGRINASGVNPANPNATEGNANTAEHSTQAAEPSSQPAKDPTIPDALGSGSLPQGGIRSPGSDYTRVEAELERIYDPECRVFGGEVFRAIFKREPLTEQTTADAKKIQNDNSEIASFKSAWSMAQNAKLKPSVMSALWNEAVAEADKLGNNRRRLVKMRKPAAVWWRIFKSLLGKAKAGELTNERANFPP
jgi:hypothetical protein